MNRQSEKVPVVSCYLIFLQTVGVRRVRHSEGLIRLIRSEINRSLLPKEMGRHQNVWKHPSGVIKFQLYMVLLIQGFEAIRSTSLSSDTLSAYMWLFLSHTDNW